MKTISLFFFFSFHFLYNSLHTAKFDCFYFYLLSLRNQIFLQLRTKSKERVVSIFFIKEWSVVSDIHSYLFSSALNWFNRQRRLWQNKPAVGQLRATLDCLCRLWFSTVAVAVCALKRSQFACSARLTLGFGVTRKVCLGPTCKNWRRNTLDGGGECCVWSGTFVV